MQKEDKKKILGQKLDAEELEQVSGGVTHKEADRECPNAGNVGGCTGAFYQERCQSSVEAGSECMSNDFNIFNYTVTQAAWDKYDDLHIQILM